MAKNIFMTLESLIFVLIQAILQKNIGSGSVCLMHMSQHIIACILKECVLAIYIIANDRLPMSCILIISDFIYNHEVCRCPVGEW